GRAQDPAPGGAQPHGSARPRDPRAPALRADDQRRRRRGPGPGEVGGEQAVHPGAGAAQGDPGRPARRDLRGGIMSEPTVDRDPFEVVAESFLARFRARERPSIEEYAARYPELADHIRELLPALVMVEQDLTIDPDPGASGVRPPPVPAPGPGRW